jgi:hypothetical protein
MFYYAAPQTLMGLYASRAAADHPVTVLYTVEPETLQFLTFTRRRQVTLESDPSRLDLARLGAVPSRQEIIVENNRRFLGLLGKLREAFSAAEISVLSDANRPSSGRVAFVLKVPPPSGSPEASPPGDGNAAPPGRQEPPPP